MNDVLQILKVPTVFMAGFSISLVVGVVLVMLGALAYFATRAPGMQSKIAGVTLVPASIALVGVALVEQLSHPKELSLAWVVSQGENGIAVHKTIIDPPKRIHLWIDIDGTPRAFFLHWSKALEQSLQEALKRWKEGQAGKLRFRFEPSLETEPQFYVMPWPAPAPKDEKPGPPPRRFEQDA